MPKAPKQGGAKPKTTRRKKKVTARTKTFRAQKPSDPTVEKHRKGRKRKRTSPSELAALSTRAATMLATRKPGVLQFDRAPALRGAPPTLTYELIDRIVEKVRTHGFLETAAALCAVPRRTFNYWLKLGREAFERLSEDTTGKERYVGNEPMYVDLLLSVEKARAECLERDMKIHDLLAQGGLPTGHVTVTIEEKPLLDEKGAPVLGEDKQPILVRKENRSEQRSVTLPDRAALQFRLERMHIEFARRTEITTPEGRPLEVKDVSDAKSTLQQKLDQIAGRLAGTAAAASAKEEEDGD